MLNALTALGFSLLCVYVEFYVPGAIFGTIGGMVYLTSLIIAFTQAESAYDLLLFMTAAVAGLVVTIRLALWQIRRKKESNTMYLNQDQEGFRAAEYRKDLIGKQGVALCDLRPGGYIIIDAQKYSAIIEMGYVSKGSQVHVIGGQGADLIVKLLTQQN